MTNWKLVSYLGRDIETPDDVMWVCEQLTKKSESGMEMDLRDIMALSYVRELYQQYLDEGRYDPIESRFDILDL
jgi:hypothetical protein